MNRRSFLKLGGAVTAASLLATPSLIAEWPAAKPLPPKLPNSEVEIFGLSDFIYTGPLATVWAGKRPLLMVHGTFRWVAPLGMELLFTSEDKIRIETVDGTPFKGTWNLIARNDKNDFFAISSTDPDRRINLRGLK